MITDYDQNKFNSIGTLRYLKARNIYDFLTKNIHQKLRNIELYILIQKNHTVSE